MVQTQFETKIQMLKTDKVKEYFEKKLGMYLQKERIVHQNSCVDTLQQNRIAGKKNRRLLEVVQSLMFTTPVPTFLWGEPVLTTT